MGKQPGDNVSDRNAAASSAEQSHNEGGGNLGISKRIQDTDVSSAARPIQLKAHRSLRESSSPRQREEARLAVMVGSLLFNISSDSTSTIKSDKEEGSTSGSESKAIEATDGKFVENEKNEERRKETEAKALQSAVQWISKEIPEDTDGLRQSRVYKNAKKLIEFQRDQYLVGRDYAKMAAEKRSKQQVSELPSNAENTSKEGKRQSLTTRSTLSSLANLLPQSEKSVEPFPPSTLPYDKSALGYTQVANVVSRQLLPLPAVYKAALPWACRVPELIYPRTERALVNIILGQQSNLDRILKNRLLTFLDNPRNRTAIKTSTRGFILSSSTSSYPAPKLKSPTPPEVASQP